MTEGVVIAPQKGAQEVAIQSVADVIVYGGAAGSGKSHLLLMHPLQYAMSDPNFQGIFFRRVTKQLMGSGGLYQESEKMYRPFNIKSRTKPEIQHTFPVGSMLSFSHMEHTKNRIDHQGLQYSFIGFDELTHFEEEQFTYLLSRLRSDAESKSYCMCTCNPDADSWVLKWIDWWLDEDGYPDPAKRGVVRHYIVVEDVPRFADTAEELIEQFPDSCRVWNPIDEIWVTVQPKTFTFVGGTIFDNPILIKKNPNYLAELKSLPDVERARLLDGNWYIREEGTNYFKREDLIKVAVAPLDGTMARGWDKAGKEPSQKERFPDCTASVKLVKDRDGRYTILGDYISRNRDDVLGVYGKIRKSAGVRDKIIEDQALHDGEDCFVVLPVDPAASGLAEYESSAKKLIEAGLMPKRDPVPINKSKLVRFTPFQVACESGLVSICESSFSDKTTLEAFYKEMESFDGERSTRQRKDDWPDACATAFNFLNMTRVKKMPRRNQKGCPSLSSNLLEDLN